MSTRRLAFVGAGVAALADVAYLALLRSQDASPVPTARAPFVVIFVGAMAIVAALSGWRRLERQRPLLLAVSAAGLASLGVLAIFSIGLLLLFAAAPLLVAEALLIARMPRPSAPLQAVGGAVVALAIMVAGMELTELPVGCPATGFAGGSGSGLVSGAYHWTCANGKLTVSRGACSSGGASVDPNGHVTASSGC